MVEAVPYSLKIKLAYPAAKGMHFLHSSGNTWIRTASAKLWIVVEVSLLLGIVHRDLKSLNILLDSKWNVKVLNAVSFISCSGFFSTFVLKVSDFGLTKFRDNLKEDSSREIQKSIQWTGNILFFFYSTTCQV